MIKFRGMRRIPCKNASSEMDCKIEKFWWESGENSKMAVVTLLKRRSDRSLVLIQYRIKRAAARTGSDHRSGPTCSVLSSAAFVWCCDRYEAIRHPPDVPGGLCSDLKRCGRHAGPGGWRG